MSNRHVIPSQKFHKPPPRPSDKHSDDYRRDVDGEYASLGSGEDIVRVKRVACTEFPTPM